MRMEEMLLNAVGPVAKMLLEQSCAECDIKKDTPIPRAAFNRLVESISKRLPEEQKKAFKKRLNVELIWWPNNLPIMPNAPSMPEARPVFEPTLPKVKKQRLNMDTWMKVVISDLP